MDTNMEQKTEKCRFCDGVGWAYLSWGYGTCPKCHGSGVIVVSKIREDET